VRVYGGTDGEKAQGTARSVSNLLRQGVHCVLLNTATFGSRAPGGQRVPPYAATCADATGQHKVLVKVAASKLGRVQISGVGRVGAVPVVTVCRSSSENIVGGKSFENNRKKTFLLQTTEHPKKATL